MVIKNKVVNKLFEGCVDVKAYGVFIRLLTPPGN